MQLLAVFILLVQVMSVFQTGENNVDTLRALWHKRGLNSG